MNKELNEFKKEFSVKWVKGESGKTYLCPVSALTKLDNPAEADLKRICVDESQSPQND